jgi:DNA ligase-1
MYDNGDEMTWIRFARLNEAIEDLAPTASIVQIKRAWDLFDNKEAIVSLLTLEYPMNNLGTKKAIKWITNAYGAFNDEIESYADMYGDLGEGVYFFDDNGEDSDLSLNQVYNLLIMDCSNIGSNSFRLFEYAFNIMSALEKKWFIRYWVRTPRHGFGKGNMSKALAKIYNKKPMEVKKHSNLNTFTNLVKAYELGEVPSMNLIVGNYIAPMLAKVKEMNKWPTDKLIEYKYDGARYQIHRDEDTVIIFNRSGVVKTHQFPDIVEKVLSWDISPFIVDSEIFPIKEDGKPAEFKHMNARFHSKDANEGMRKCPCALAIFDCLMYKGNGLIDTPLKDRLQFIELFPDQAERVVNPDNTMSFYAKAISAGYEGMMIKDLNQTYKSKNRGWIKYKPPTIDLDVVITGARYGDGKRSSVMASFDMAISDSDGEFIGIGAIGTGFSDVDFLTLTRQLKPIVTYLEKDTHKVSPRVVLEITADMITTNDKGEYGLRFPRMKRIRNDKPVSQINTIDDLKEMM